MSISGAEVFLDTNILLFAAQGRRSCPEKFEIARRIICDEDYCTSAQVLAEFYVNAVRNGDRPLAPDEAVEWMRIVAKKPCQPLDAQIVRRAVALSDRFRVTYWDATIIAAAERLGARTLYTEELEHGQDFGTVTAIDPFQVR